MNSFSLQPAYHQNLSWGKIYDCLNKAGQMRTGILELIKQFINSKSFNENEAFQLEEFKVKLTRLCSDYQHSLTHTFYVVSSEANKLDGLVLDEGLSNLTSLLKEQTLLEHQYVAEIQNLAGLARNCLDDLSHYGLDFCQDPQLKQVFEYIEGNYQNAIGLRDVAQTLGYSTAYLTDFVRRKTGQTVNQWIINRRLSEACHLLLTTNQSIESIAMSIGYQNVGHFFRQFRKNYDSTPQTWRNKMRIQAGANRNQEVDSVEKLFRILT